MRASIPPTLQSEFTDWVVNLMIEVGFMEPQLGAIVAMSPSIDTARLARAIRLVMDAEPILGCRFVADSKRPYWERLDNLDENPGILERDGDQPVRISLDWLSEEFSPLDGPQMRAQVCIGGPETVLALKFSHVALDAAAMKEALYSIADIYRALGDDPEYEPIPNLSGQRSVAPAAGTASLRQRLKAWRPDDPFPQTDWGMPNRSDPHVDGGSMYFTRHLGRDSFKPIQKWGRERGATVNDLLLTAYYRTLVDVLEPGPDHATPVQLSCDYRRWLPEGTATSLGNISGTWCIAEGLDREASFEETLGAITRRTTAWKASDAGIQAALGLSLASRLPYDTVAGRVTKQALQYVGETGYPVITNIGVLDEARLHFGSAISIADAFALGPISHPPGFVMGVSSFREEMTISAGFNSSKLEESYAERVLDGVVARLELLRATH